MFIEKLQQNNPKLIQVCIDLLNDGLILPDTYVLDYDAIIDNAKNMKKIADENDIRLFYMLKQIGRNPIVAKGLEEIGFDGCVAVDYKEALLMKNNNCKLGHVGHLVQIPKGALATILEAKPEYITVYSYEIIKQINDICKDYGHKQKIILRIIDDDSDLYSGQVGGFSSDELKILIDKISKLENIIIGGLTVFPALLFDNELGKVVPTNNMKAMNRAKNIMEQLGYKDLMINLPSCTCANTIPLIKQLGGTCGEPGHGLTGTTPLHKISDEYEKIGYAYVSEISHNYKNSSYCYGGGHYRRSHVEYALVGNDLTKVKIVMPDQESIDYHFELEGNYDIGQPVIMCFRTQVFTTRSHVAVVKNVNSSPELVGIYNAFGEPINNAWSK